MASRRRYISTFINRCIALVPIYLPVIDPYSPADVQCSEHDRNMCLELRIQTSELGYCEVMQARSFSQTDLREISSRIPANLELLVDEQAHKLNVTS